MKLTGTVLATLALVSIATAAELNLLKNPSFAPKNKVEDKSIPGWRIMTRGAEGAARCVLRPEGLAELTVSAADSGVFLLQEQLPLVAGKRYRCSFEGKSSSGSPIRVYVEWVTPDGKYLSAGTNGATTADWQAYSFEFNAPGSELKKSPYLGCVLRTVGAFAVRNLRVECVTVNDEQ